MRNKERVSVYNKKYRIENKEKVRLLQAYYYKKHRLERIKDANDWRLNHPDRYNSTRRAYMSTPAGRLSSTKSSAKTRGIEYLLSDKIAISILSSSCYFCGKREEIGIDRLNSDMAYLKGNCVACCKMCNRMKQIYGKDEFLERCKLISARHS